MIERAHGPDFTQKPIARGRIGGMKRQREFQRDVAIQPHIARVIDNRHSAGSDRFENFEMRDRPAAQL